MGRRRVLWGSCVLLVVAGVVLVIVRHHTLSVRPEALDLSWQATRTDRPLDDQGRLDLTTALPATKAPPPDENAVVALLALVGTDALLGDREQVLRRLGAPAGLPSKGRLEALPQDVRGGESLADLEAGPRASLERWLAAQAPTLDALVEATRRPRFWSPMVVAPERDGLLTPALPLFALGDLTNALLKRAELRMLQGEWQSGWDDLEGMLRLQDLTDMPGGFISGFVRSGFLRVTTQTLGSALRSQGPPNDLSHELTATLSQRNPARSLRAELEFERVNVVATYLWILLGKRVDPRERTEAFAQANRAIRAIHASLDGVGPWMDVVSTENADRLEVEAQALRARLKAEAEQGESAWGKVGLLVRTWWHGDGFVGHVSGELMASMILAVTPLRMQKEIQNEALRRMAILALALRRYRLEHGAFPATLDALGAGALEALSSDPLGVGPIAYRLSDEGCVLGTERDEFELLN